MSSSSLCGAPSPSSFDEADLGPEKIRRKVFRNPRSQLPGVQLASVGVFEVIDEGSAVLDESSVLADPNLKDPDFAEGVGAPEDEADAIVIAKERKKAIVVGRIFVGSVWEEADRVAVERDGVVGKLDDRSVGWFAFRFDDFQGVQGRVTSSDRFWGQLVAAISGKCGQV